MLWLLTPAWDGRQQLGACSWPTVSSAVPHPPAHAHVRYDTRCELRLILSPVPCFVTEQGSADAPVSGKGVLIELVQAPKEVREALS